MITITDIKTGTKYSFLEYAYLLRNNESKVRMTKYNPNKKHRQKGIK